MSEEQVALLLQEAVKKMKAAEAIDTYKSILFRVYISIFYLN